MTSALEPLKFSPGDQVQKVGGSYQAKGIVVAAFNTTGGAARYVFEFTAFPGMLHIFTGAQLQPDTTSDR